MKKRRREPIVSKKQRTLARRERKRMNWILGGTLAVAAVVIGLLLFGYIDYRYLQGRRPIATVNEEEISTSVFRARVRLLQMDLAYRINSQLELASYFADSPELAASFQQQVDQMIAQYNSPVYMGQSALQQLIEEALMRQELVDRGLTFDETEVDRLVAELFGYYPEGTPTARPTATADPTALAEIEPSPTPTEGPTETPAPTSTPYTEEAFQENYQAYLETLTESGVNEEDFRAQYRGILLREFLTDEMQKDVPREADQVWLRHILVEDEATAEEVLLRLEQGEPWADLAAELSQDLYTSEQGGDLGWMTMQDLMDQFGSELAELAFDTPVGEIFGPVETAQGWELVEVLGHEVRELDDEAYRLLVEDTFSRWLESEHTVSDIIVEDDWLQRVPEPPG
ncbi:MAG: peptidylprolyl isomerase [Anaerolineales bacterium]|jgi:parvulin-like peptidyl-prolyl isomerase